MKKIRVQALMTVQGKGIRLYSFFLPGFQISQIAQISRICRDEENTLVGFQRKEIKNHVKRIVEYLDTGDVLFPNAILLAMSSDVQFKESRGRKPRGVVNSGFPGVLEIPLYGEGDPVAWIVDGQQRSLALQQTKNSNLPVPVIAFVSDSIEIQREQFVLVNKARPLPSRLINELLPTISTVTIPRDLAPRKIPSEICSLLNQDLQSPFYNIIRQSSSEDGADRVVVDTALINVIKRSIRNPLGALSPYKSAKNGNPDIEKMYRMMFIYWSEVKNVFSDAWGLPPTKSRLMHSAGIEAMGYYMDKVMSRTIGSDNLSEDVRKTLIAIKPYCRWTSGTWEGIGLKWNEVQSIDKHIRMIADTLVQIDFQVQLSQ